MRLLGIGVTGVQLFTSMMDLCKFTNWFYYGALTNIKVSVDAVTEVALKKAVQEEKQLNVKNGLSPNELIVSGDGTWQTRGFSSLLGVTSLIGKYSSKVLDFFVSNKMCRACETIKAKRSSAEFSIWFESAHKTTCPVNYEGSSGGMEAQAVISMFRRSLELHGIRYSHYIGDGDSKTFSQLLQNAPYGEDLIVEKLECINHVSKRMFKQPTSAKRTITQVKNLKAKEKKELEEEDEPPKKKKRPSNPKMDPQQPKTAQLTGEVIKSMCLIYGIAIRQNPNSVADMKRDIWAIFNHKISTDENPKHEDCSETCCKYLKAQKTKEKFVHSPAFDPLVQEYVKPVFDNLTRDDLLERCLGRNTQNNNESFNNVLWSMAPKYTLSGMEVVEVSSGIATCLFNEGKSTLLKMMETIGVTIGPKAADFCAEKDEFRVKRAETRNSDAAKKARIESKKKKQQQEEAFQEADGLLYGAGIDDS